MLTIELKFLNYGKWNCVSRKREKKLSLSLQNIIGTGTVLLGEKAMAKYDFHHYVVSTPSIFFPLTSIGKKEIAKTWFEEFDEPW